MGGLQEDIMHCNGLFVAAVTAPAHKAGQLFYDSVTDSLTFHNSEADVALQIGEENWIRVCNETGATIADSTIVYLSGTSASGCPLIEKAQANAEATTHIIGIVTHSIEDSTEGYATTFGLVRGLNTSAFAGGAAIYLSPTTAGAVTTTKPTGSNYVVRIGYIATVDATDGSFLVSVENGGDTTDIANMNQDNTIYVGKHGLDSNSGLNIGQAKLTIQAAVTIAAANATILVYPGEYAETITHTANNVSLIAQGKPNNVIISQADANVVNFSTYTGIQYKNFGIQCTAATSAINTVEGTTGNCAFKECTMKMTSASAIVASAQPAVGSICTGTLKVILGKIEYAHTGACGGTALKGALKVGDGGLVKLSLVKGFTINNSGTALATSTGIDTSSTGVFEMDGNEISIIDPTASVVAGLAYLGGTGINHEYSRNIIHVTVGAANVGYGIFTADTASVTRSYYNHIHVVDTGGSSYGFIVGTGAELISQIDDVVAADGNTINGTFTQVNSQSDGDFTISNTLTVSDIIYPTADGTVGQSMTTDGAGTLSFSSALAGGGIAWTRVTGTTQALAVNNGYVNENVALTTLTLPSTAAFGSAIKINGEGTGLYRVAQNASQQIHFGILSSTIGVGGYIEATQRRDCITLRCTVANTEFILESPSGNIDVV